MSITATNTTSEPSLTISSQRPSSINEKDTRLQSPCPNDPFWDYYSVIGDISRVNGKELVRVANWIGADQVVRIFLQNWLSTRIRPLDLPNVFISTPYHRNKWNQLLAKMQRNRNKMNSMHNGNNSESFSSKIISKSNKSPGDPKSNNTLSSINNEETHEPILGLPKNNLNLKPNDKIESKSDHGSTHSQSNLHVERANSSHSVISDDSQDQFGFVLHSASVLNLIKQCIKLQTSGDAPSGDIGASVESRFDNGIVRAHPNAFELPGMAEQRRVLSHGAHKFRSEFEKQARKQHSRMRTAVEQRLNFGAFAVFDLFNDESWDDFRNSVGCIVLSCLDQQSFIAASLVCRAWFYSSRFGFARSHIRLGVLCFLLVETRNACITIITQL